MWDLIPSWLADPSAYAQPENLDMTTVIVVALANLFFGLCCLAVYECVRRKTPRTYAPRIQLGHATPPPLPTHFPLSWVAPLMRLDEEQILAIGGYDVLVYLRFTALSLKIFGSFAPYAVILLIVNMSASYDDGPSLPNLFTRLSLAVIPERDPRLWAHLLGIVILTSLTFHWLGRECRWYTRLRHRFLLERPDARVVFVRRLPPKLRGSRSLATYFDELYPGKVVGAVGARRTATLDSLIAARDAHRVRAARLRRRRAQHKGRGLSCVDKAHARLEDAYDPLFWTRSLDAAARLRLHDERAAERDDRLVRERQRAAAQEPLVASGQAAAPAVNGEKGVTHDVPQRLSSGAWEADDECAGGVFFSFPRGDGVRCTPSTRREYPDGRAASQVGGRRGALGRGHGLDRRPRERGDDGPAFRKAESGHGALLRRRLRRLPDAVRRGRRDAGFSCGGAGRFGGHARP